MNKASRKDKKITKKWQTLQSKVIFKNQWLALEESKVIMPNGRNGIYTVVNTKPFVVIVAKKKDKVLMVRQHRFTINAQTVEFPAGGIEAEERPLAAAKRELTEETGYIAKRWTLLGELDDAIGIARHKAYVFLASDLKPADPDKLFEETEDVIEMCDWIGFEKIKTMIEKNKITDTKTIAIFYKMMLQSP